MEDLTPKKTVIVDSNDNIVIKKVFKTLEGGRALDLTQWYATNGEGAPVPAGWLIVMNESKKFVPCPIKSNAFDLSTTTVTPVGVLMDTITAPRQAAAIMTQGVVNPAIMKYYTKTVVEGLHEKGLLITFEADSDAGLVPGII